MGGAASKKKNTTKITSLSLLEDDNKILFSALRKLSPLFVTDEYLSKSLTNEIMDKKHINLQAQFAGVKEWVKKHGRDGGDCIGTYLNLTVEEIDHLIQYVEMFFDNNQEILPEDANKPKSASADRRNCPLMHPHRADLILATDVIRSSEEKDISPSAETVNIRFSENQSSPSCDDHSHRFSDRQSARRLSSADSKSSMGDSVSFQFFDCSDCFSDGPSGRYSNGQSHRLLERSSSHIGVDVEEEENEDEEGEDEENAGRVE